MKVTKFILLLVTVIILLVSSCTYYDGIKPDNSNSDSIAVQASEFFERNEGKIDSALLDLLVFSVRMNNSVNVLSSRVSNMETTINGFKLENEILRQLITQAENQINDNRLYESFTESDTLMIQAYDKYGSPAIIITVIQ